MTIISEIPVVWNANLRFHDARRLLFKISEFVLVCLLFDNSDSRLGWLERVSILFVEVLLIWIVLSMAHDQLVIVQSMHQLWAKDRLHILYGRDAKQDARFTDAFVTRTCLSLEIVPKQNISVDRFEFASLISLQGQTIDPVQFRFKYSPNKCLLPFWTRIFLHTHALSSTCTGQYNSEVLAESTTNSGKFETRRTSEQCWSINIPPRLGWRACTHTRNAVS